MSHLWIRRFRNLQFIDRTVKMPKVARFFRGNMYVHCTYQNETFWTIFKHSAILQNTLGIIIILSWKYVTPQYYGLKIRLESRRRPDCHFLLRFLGRKERNGLFGVIAASQHRRYLAESWENRTLLYCLSSEEPVGYCGLFRPKRDKVVRNRSFLP